MASVVVDGTSVGMPFSTGPTAVGIIFERDGAMDGSMTLIGATIVFIGVGVVTCTIGGDVGVFVMTVGFVVIDG